MSADPAPNADVWLVVPLFNEAQVIGDVVREARRTFPHVVCIDDGSSDSSAQVASEAGAVVVRHPVNLGQGAALQTGLTYARSRPGAAFFITFDSDGQHRVEDAARMVEVARRGDADIVLGTRFADRSAEVPLLKRIALRLAVRLSPSGRRLGLTDAHNGLRVLARPAAEDLHISMNGMAHASEIISWLGRSRWRVREVPVTIRYTDYSRAKGQSLLNGVNILFDLSVRQRGG